MVDLNELRQQINEIDEQIIGLLNSRMNTVMKVSRYKKENNLPVYAPRVEKEKIEKLSELSYYPGMVETIWPSIMCFARSIE